VQVHIKMPTWYGCMSQPGRHCVRWEPSHPPIRGTAAHPQFSARVYFGKLIAISATAEYLSYNFGHFSCKTASNLTKITETPQRRRTTLSLPELMRFQFLFESVQWSTDCCHAGQTADQRAKLRYVEKLLHGCSRAFLGDRLYKSSAVAEMGDLGHNRHGQKGGDAVPLSQGGAGSPSNTLWPGLRSPSVPSGIFIHIAVWPLQTWAENWELGPHLTQCRLGWDLSPYQVASWSIQPFGHNTYGPKIGGCAPDSIGRTGLETVAQKRFALCYPVLSVCL